jgi:hypothetical protein
VERDHRLDKAHRYTWSMVASAGTSLAPWSVRLIAELNASDERARQLVMGLSPEQLMWQPAPAVWSVGQCLDHLCIANEAYLPAISISLDGQAISAVAKIKPGWFSRWFVRVFIEPSPQSWRAPAPKKIVPAARVELSVLERFLRGNQAARELVRRASNYDVNHVRFKNPLNRLFRFTVGTGLEIVCGHERRHLLQAERVIQMADFPR